LEKGDIALLDFVKRLPVCKAWQHSTYRVLQCSVDNRFFRFIF